jgi:hypothetical protein
MNVAVRFALYAVGILLLASLHLLRLLRLDRALLLRLAGGAQVVELPPGQAPESLRRPS